MSIGDHSAAPWDQERDIVLGGQLHGARLMEVMRRAREVPGDGGDAATSVIASASIPTRRLASVVDVLLELAGDPDLWPYRRGLAAEGVGGQLAYSKQRSLTRRASLCLTELLEDPVPDVRFWSAFSLGTIRARRARAALRRLSTDVTTLDGWWTVGEEATDALAIIEGRRHDWAAADRLTSNRP